jgi:hypothetical protein
MHIMSRFPHVPTIVVPGRVGAVACILLMAGCAAVAPASQPAATGLPAADANVLVESQTAPSVPAAQRPPSATTRHDVAAHLPPAAVALPPVAAQQPKTPAPSVAVAKPAAPAALDLEALETRLKETKAFGVLTKLALKNQIDDLLDRFRAYYQGRLKTTLGELRQAFDALVLRTVALLQDTDPSLARAIVSSRESLWVLLADPAKFATR